MKSLIRIAALSAAVFATSAALASPPSQEAHFDLSKSTPAAGASIEAPSEIRLWFTEEPQEGTTSIRLVEAAEAGVHVMEVTQDPEDPTSFFVALHGTLATGTYTVSWRGMGSDGHVMRDTFSFTVAER